MAMMAAFASFANAQEQQVKETQQVPQQDNKIEAHVKRMTDRFLLDDAKAVKFAPLYQAYLEEKATCRPELVFGEKLTDAQLEANMEAMLEVREKALEIDKKYYKKLSKLLNTKQLDMIFGMQAQFGMRPMGFEGMPPCHFGKPAAPNEKFSKEFRKGGHKKAPGRKKNGGCKKADECAKAGKDCDMKANCKKECKQDGKCNKVEACVTATECENAAVCDKAADIQE